MAIGESQQLKGDCRVWGYPSLLNKKAPPRRSAFSFRLGINH
ncbi:hypothetical protein MICAK_3600016 [Microcystis aeruginosa PCC 9701]|uniref:Uncharacterized protein n=1 Tax=Microcystis aeruginosa PCC 9701 TaxID=721123 RepID=I4IUD2_MICAE|nr:hypothetical protein MICAK_3600016 [Microcystis aeruginosa PCC 9701]